jgi:D-sedoheptulose 7-phosphate isomerase
VDQKYFAALVTYAMNKAVSDDISRDTRHDNEHAAAALVSTHFAAAASAAANVAGLIARDTVRAAQLITAAFLSNHKLCVAGVGIAAVDAQYLVARLCGELEQARPGLPALLISGDVIMGANDTQSTRAQHMVRQIMALGNPNDVLMIVCCGDQASAVGDLIAAARERDMHVVTLARQIDFEALDTFDHLTRAFPEDVRLAIEEQRIIRMLELERIALHALSDVIDSLLLGDG